MATFRILAARVPVIVITHDAAVAAACDRTIVLQGAIQTDMRSMTAVLPAASSAVLPKQRHRPKTGLAVAAAVALLAAGVAGVILSRHPRPATPMLHVVAARNPTPSTAAAGSPPSSPADGAGLVSLANTPATTSYSGNAPLDVVFNYYAAINAKNWPLVWQLGGDNLGEHYTKMVRGYANTADDIPYITGINGDVINVLLLAYETSGLAQLYSSSLLIQNGAIVQAQQQREWTDPNSDFTALAGDWYGHDRDLQITPGGLGILSYRTFNWCDSIASGCDEMVDNQIINGGLTIFRLTGGQGTEAQGRIRYSTTGESGPITLTADSSNDTLTLPGGIRYCGADAPQGECGA
jgi:hypothetical protein